MLLATECDSRGRIGPTASYRDAPFPQGSYLETALAAARGVNAGEIAQASAATPQRIPELVRRARVTAVKVALKAADVEGEDEEEPRAAPDGGSA